MGKAFLYFSLQAADSAASLPCLSARCCLRFASVSVRPPPMGAGGTGAGAVTVRCFLLSGSSLDDPFVVVVVAVRSMTADACVRLRSPCFAAAPTRSLSRVLLVLLLLLLIERSVARAARVARLFEPF